MTMETNMKREWRDMIENYIPDDCTTIDIVEDCGVIALAISYVEGRHMNDLQVFVGTNYYEVFEKSGYLESFLSYVDDYELEQYTDEQVRLIKQAQEDVFGKEKK